MNAGPNTNVPYSTEQLRADEQLQDACLDLLYQYRYGAFKECPACGFPVAHYRIKGRPLYWFCTKYLKGQKHCSMHQVSPRSGTIFAHSSIPLPIWFEALYLYDATYNMRYRAMPVHNRIPTTSLALSLGITQKSAWRVKYQLGKLYQQDREFYNAILLWWVQHRQNCPLVNRKTF